MIYDSMIYPGQKQHPFHGPWDSRINPGQAAHAFPPHFHVHPWNKSQTVLEELGIN